MMVIHLLLDANKPWVLIHELEKMLITVYKIHQTLNILDRSLTTFSGARYKFMYNMPYIICFCCCCWYSNKYFKNHVHCSKLWCKDALIKKFWSSYERNFKNAKKKKNALWATQIFLTQLPLKVHNECPFKKISLRIFSIISSMLIQESPIIWRTAILWSFPFTLTELDGPGSGAVSNHYCKPARKGK